MAMDDAERAYYAKAKAAGFPDELIAERIRTRREETSPYKPTNYGGEAAKLPSRAPEYEALMARGLSPEDAVQSVSHTDQLVAGRSPESRRHDEDPVANDPLAQMVLAGTVGAGAGALVGGASRLAPHIPAILRPALAGAANSATQTAMTGGSGEDVLKSVGIGAAIPIAGQVAGKIGNAIRGGEGGQARQLWEKHGGNVGPLDSGSGVEEIAGLEPTRNNVGRASAIGARNIRRGMDAEFDREVGAPFRDAKNAVDYSPASSEMTDVTSLVQTIGEVPKALRGRFRSELQDLGATMTEDGRVMMSQSSLNEARKRLEKIANYGLNDGPGTANLKDESFKSVANAAKVLVDEGPYAEANDIYHRGMNMRQADRASIGLATEPAKTLKGRTTEDARVAQIIRNRNADSEAAGAMAERADLPGFVARHPDLERQVDLPDLLRAKGRLEFGLDHTKTANLHGLEEAAGKGWLRKALTLASDNSAAFAGRVAYRPAGAGIVADDILSSPEMNQILAAYAAQKEQERRRAEALGR